MLTKQRGVFSAFEVKPRQAIPQISKNHIRAVSQLFAGEDVGADHNHFLRLVFGIEFGEHPGDAECVDRHRVFIPEISVENINHGVLLLRGVAGRQQDVHVRIASGGCREIRVALESSVIVYSLIGYLISVFTTFPSKKQKTTHSFLCGIEKEDAFCISAIQQSYFINLESAFASLGVLK